MMKSFIFLVSVVIIFGGCEQSDTKSVKIFGDTYHKIPTGYQALTTPPTRKTREDRDAEKEKAMALAKLKSEENLKIAQIEADGKEKVKLIEVEATKLKVLSEKEISLGSQKIEKAIAFIKEKTILDTKDKDLFINQLIIIAIVVMGILALLVYYIIQHKKRALESKIEEDRVKHEEYMQAATHQHEKISRVLGIIADKDTDEYVKKELLSIIKEQPQDQLLIAYTSQDDDDDSLDEYSKEEDKKR